MFTNFRLVNLCLLLAGSISASPYDTTQLPNGSNTTTNVKTVVVTVTEAVTLTHNGLLSTAPNQPKPVPTGNPQSSATSANSSPHNTPTITSLSSNSLSPWPISNSTLATNATQSLQLPGFTYPTPSKSTLSKPPTTNSSVPSIPLNESPPTSLPSTLHTTTSKPETSHAKSFVKPIPADPTVSGLPGFALPSTSITSEEPDAEQLDDLVVEEEDEHDANDPTAWADTQIQPRRSFWSRFFVHAHPHPLPQLQPGVSMPPNGLQQIIRDGAEGELVHALDAGQVDESQCVQCTQDDGSVKCIGDTHYGLCDEGCAQPRRLLEGYLCVEGRVFGDMVYARPAETAGE